MKISIITVTYNSEKTLKDTIESVLKQNYENYEHIIVDGKSKDSTVDIIKEYEEEYNGKLKYISEKDNGIYDAMNKGITKAKGDYLLFLNADDTLFSKRTINDEVEYMQNDMKASDVYFGNIEIKNEYGVYVQKPRSLEMLPYKMVLSHQAVFIRRDLLIKNLFDLKYRYSADYKQLSTLYLLGYKFCYIDLAIAHTPMDAGATYNNYIISTKEHFKILRERGCNVYWTEKRTIILRTIVRYVKKYMPNCLLHPILRIVSKYKIL